MSQVCNPKAERREDTGFEASLSDIWKKPVRVESWEGGVAKRAALATCEDPWLEL